MDVEIDVEVDVTEAETTTVEVGAVVVTDVVAVTVLLNIDQLSSAIMNLGQTIHIISRSCQDLHRARSDGHCLEARAVGSRRRWKRRRIGRSHGAQAVV